MELLDRLLGHDVWTTRQLLRQCATLTDAELDRRFDVDNRTLRECFLHIIGNMEVWTATLADHPEPVAPTGDEARSVAGMLTRLGSVGRTFAANARAVTHEGREDELLVTDSPIPLPRGSVIAHLLTHSMHHRAQAMYMMEQLGLRDHIEGDVLSWETITFGWQE